MRTRRKAAEHLRQTVEMLPTGTRLAMLDSLDSERIIVGAYTDRSGGVCPMLAAHRNGGRTNFAAFARAWDRFTGVGKRPRRASVREVRALRSYLESSLLRDEQRDKSLVELAAEIRSERREAKAVEARESERTAARSTGERDRSPELRRRTGWAWLRPARSYDLYRQLLAEAEEQASEQRASALPVETVEGALDDAETALGRAESALR